MDQCLCSIHQWSEAKVHRYNHFEASLKMWVYLEKDRVQRLCGEKIFCLFPWRSHSTFLTLLFFWKTFSLQVCKLIMLSSDTTFENALSTRHQGLHISVTWKTLVEFQFQFNLLPIFLLARANIPFLNIATQPLPEAVSKFKPAFQHEIIRVGLWPLVGSLGTSETKW